MKKYQKLESVGNVLVVLGVIVLMLGLSINLDHSTRIALSYFVLFMISGSLLMIIGLAFRNYYLVKREIFCLVAHLSSKLYKLLRKPIRYIEACYKIESESNSRSDALNKYQKAFDSYMDYKFNDSDLIDNVVEGGDVYGSVKHAAGSSR